jgi:hypothetical protein
MVERGYTYATMKICPCGASMELWHVPNRGLIPMNPMPDDDSKAESHFATCPKAVQFRKPPQKETN